MKHKEDGIRSIAIDEFPVMTDKAIEAFWIDKVEMKKVAREEAFRRLEVQALFQRKHGGNIAGGALSSKETIEQVRNGDIHSLLDEVDSPAAAAARRAQSLDTQSRVVEPFVAQEAALAEMSLSELYEISINSGEDFTGYQRELARIVLDEHMAEA